MAVFTKILIWMLFAFGFWIAWNYAVSRGWLPFWPL